MNCGLCRGARRHCPPTAIRGTGETKTAQTATNTVLASIERFPSTDPTGVANSALATQAAIDAVPEGGRSSSRRNLQQRTRITTTGRSFAAQAYGVLFIKTVNDAAFDFAGEYDTQPRTLSL